MSGTPGEEYWERVYGIESLEDFRAITDRFWPNSGALSLFFDKELSQRLAYESPFSAHGLLANAIVANWYRSGGDVPSTTALSDSTNRYINDGAGAGSTFFGAPMPQLVIANTYLASIVGSSGGQDVVNVIGLRGATGGLAAEAAAAVRDAWKVAAGPLAQRPSQYALKEIRVMDLSTLNGDIAVIADSTAGGIASQLLATNAACALVKWNGGTRSRSSRGRLYHGPITENDTNSDGRTIATARMTAIGTAYNNMRTSLSGNGFTHCVISRKLAQTFDVSSVAVEQVIATQRRRIR